MKNEKKKVKKKGKKFMEVFEILWISLSLSHTHSLTHRYIYIYETIEKYCCRWYLFFIIVTLCLSMENRLLRCKWIFFFVKLENFLRDHNLVIALFFWISSFLFHLSPVVVVVYFLLDLLNMPFCCVETAFHFIFALKVIIIFIDIDDFMCEHN